jgi:hypothetical protein
MISRILYYVRSYTCLRVPYRISRDSRDETRIESHDVGKHYRAETNTARAAPQRYEPSGQERITNCNGSRGEYMSR